MAKSKCDCTKIPFTPECRKYCIDQVLRTATPEEKQLIIGLDKKLATDIFNAYNTRDIQEFEDLELILTPDQVQTLLSKFDTLNQFQLTYLIKSSAERRQINNLLRNMRLDSNDAQSQMYSEE